MFLHFSSPRPPIFLKSLGSNLWRKAGHEFGRVKFVKWSINFHWNYYHMWKCRPEVVAPKITPVKFRQKCDVNLKARIIQFQVTPIYPDGYGQISQKRTAPKCYKSLEVGTSWNAPKPSAKLLAPKSTLASMGFSKKTFFAEIADVENKKHKWAHQCASEIFLLPSIRPRHKGRRMNKGRVHCITVRPRFHLQVCPTLNFYSLSRCRWYLHVFKLMSVFLWPTGPVSFAYLWLMQWVNKNLQRALRHGHVRCVFPDCGVEASGQKRLMLPGWP